MQPDSTDPANVGIGARFYKRHGKPRHEPLGLAFLSFWDPTNCRPMVCCPPCCGSPYSVVAQIDQNPISENDVGVWVVELDAFGKPPTTMTNVKVVNNAISKAGFTNPYQAGVSDSGNNDKVIANRISGAGYDPSFLGRFSVDADPSFTNCAKAHANK